jgi:type VI secretion system protein ImpK
MRESIASLVFPVILHGLRLRERLERGEQPDLDNEQAALKGLLGAGGAQARLWASSEGAHFVPTDTSRSVSPAAALPAFRYALVCWLDEVFTVDSPRESWWRERTLEESLYGTRERAWKYWEQARRAEGRPGSDELEVFYLCVMLGFRGDLRDQPDRLRAWRDAAEARITQGQAQDWPPPPERETPSHVPPLRGRERVQRMVLVAAAVLLLLIPAATFYLVLQLQ